MNKKKKEHELALFLSAKSDTKDMIFHLWKIIPSEHDTKAVKVAWYEVADVDELFKSLDIDIQFVNLVFKRFYSYRFWYDMLDNYINNYRNIVKGLKEI